MNQGKEPVVRDDGTGEKKERVVLGEATPKGTQGINPGETLKLRGRQRKSEQREYRARLKGWMRKRCVGGDTTVLVRGGGFAQTRGLKFSFDQSRALPDTFTMVSCDTLYVPI